MESNTEKWKKTLESFPERPSIREVQKPAGIIIWDMVLKQKRVSEVQSTIDTLSVLGSQAFQQGHDCVAQIGANEVLLLLEALNKVIENKWAQANRRVSYERQIIMTSDSSGAASGIVELEDGVDVIATVHSFFEKWGEMDIDRDIWEKELLTILRAMEIVERRTNGPQRARIKCWAVVDNSITFYALSSRTCANIELRPRLEVLQRLEDLGVDVFPLLVPSKEMPADLPSRNEKCEGPDFEFRIGATINRIRAHNVAYEKSLLNPVEGIPKKRKR